MDLALISHLQLYYIFTFALIVIHFAQFPFEIFQLGLLLTVTLISNKQSGNRFPPPVLQKFHIATKCSYPANLLRICKNFMSGMRNGIEKFKQKMPFSPVRPIFFTLFIFVFIFYKPLEKIEFIPSLSFVWEYTES